MKFAFFTLKYSVFFLKTNFIFMIFLQIIKLSLNKQQSNSALNNSEFFQTDQQPHIAETDTNYFDLFKSCFKKFFTSFISTFTYDVKQMEATKTEIINFVKLNEPTIQSANNRGANLNPSIISESYVNFSELLQFSNIKHIIKLTYLFNLNLNCILINLALISYFLVKIKKNKSRRIGDFFSKKFLKLNLFLVSILFIVFILTDSLYMLFLNSSFRSQPNKIEKSNVKDSNVLIDYLLNYVNILDKKQPDYLDEKSQPLNKDIISVESSYSSLHSSNNIPNMSNENEYLTMVTLRINILIMILSICMLSFYSYITRLDMESCSFSCKFFILYKFSISF